MTTLHLPNPVQQYFTASNSGHVEDLVSCFTPDARVHDEGRWLQGREALTKWARDSQAQYNVVISPRAVEQSSDREPVVLAEVTGTFPGSPIDLRFHFTIDNGAIDTLVIKP